MDGTTGLRQCTLRERHHIITLPRRLRNEYYSKMRKRVHDHGEDEDRTTGEEYVGVFGTLQVVKSSQFYPSPLIQVSHVPPHQ